jgi:enoyl-CoA hydratase/carnithine racemase
MSPKFVVYETLHLTSARGSDKHIGIIRFHNPTHFWNDYRLPWGTRVGEHRFNHAFLDELAAALDKAESDCTLVGIIFTGDGKYFLNGIDTEYIKANPSDSEGVQRKVESIFVKVLSLKCITIAAINGHATATGAIFAMCCDFRLMTERGFFFVPAVDIGIVYSQGMVEVLKSKITDSNLQRDFMLLSKRYTSTDILRMGLITAVTSAGNLLHDAFELIKNNWKENGDCYAEVRKRIYASAVSELTRTHVSDMRWGNLSKL